MDLSKVKSNAVVAEFVGTFMLAIAVLVSINGAVPQIPTPALAGIVLGLVAMGVGAVSGAHINPAVTLGMLSIKKIDRTSAVAYIVVQFAAALLALAVVSWFQEEAIPREFTVAFDGREFFAEILGAAVFTYGVAAAVSNKYSGAAAGLLVGGSLFLGATIASFAGSGVINPAVALSVSSISWAYVVGPVVGAILGMNLFVMMIPKNRKI